VGRRFSLIVFALLAASAVSVGTLAVRIHETGSLHYLFLVWNLFLAWVPLVAAYFAFVLARRGAGVLAGVLVVAWLLFFPNAPYMLTDFVHLREPGTSPLWYDALMLSSFAWTALMVGFLSLYLVQAIIVRRAGTAVGWIGVVCVLGLASFGIYIGRFVGLNSWDAVTRPSAVLDVVFKGSFQDPKMVAGLLGLTVSLFVGYLVVYAFSSLGRELAEA
jgi:uncharacterized membrane protein